MIVIELPKNIYIYTDSEYNYIYAKKQRIGDIAGTFEPKPENIGKEYFIELAYYPSFESCWNGVINYLGLQADSLQEYSEILDVLKKIKELEFPKKEIIDIKSGCKPRRGIGRPNLNILETD